MTDGGWAGGAPCEISDHRPPCVLARGTPPSTPAYSSPGSWMGSHLQYARCASRTWLVLDHGVSQTTAEVEDPYRRFVRVRLRLPAQLAHVHVVLLQSFPCMSCPLVCAMPHLPAVSACCCPRFGGCSRPHRRRPCASSCSRRLQELPRAWRDRLAPRAAPAVPYHVPYAHPWSRSPTSRSLAHPMRWPGQSLLDMKRRFRAAKPAGPAIDEPWGRPIMPTSAFLKGEIGPKRAGSSPFDVRKSQMRLPWAARPGLHRLAAFDEGTHLVQRPDPFGL